MNCSPESVRSRLDEGLTRENLGKLFLETLHWGKPSDAAPKWIILDRLPDRLLAEPIAQIAGVPVYYVDWPGETLPGVTLRRQVHNRLAFIGAEHLVWYVKGPQAALTFARRRSDGKTELRTLPYQIGSPARTTVEQLAKLAFSFDELGPEGRPPISIVIDKLNAAFDVQAVTKKFFEEIANWYFWARGHVVFPMPKGEKNPEAYLSQSLIRLITRLIFCWFIKQMGLIPRELFDLQTLSRLLKDGENLEESNRTIFYKAILQNLFFATLNQEIDKRQFRKRNKDPRGRNPHRGITNLYRYEDLFADPQAFIKLVERIPFLNGGLFECLDQVYRAEENRPDVRIDGFSDHPKNPLSVPDFLFFGKERTVDLSGAYGEARYKRAVVRGLIHIFNRYNFTVTESTPLDQEVALDPEMAGKIFENLLASYNPETATTARKQTGSFYTPREIVDYMVDESLIAYLKGKLGESNSRGLEGNNCTPANSKGEEPLPRPLSEGERPLPRPLSEGEGRKLTPGPAPKGEGGNFTPGPAPKGEGRVFSNNLCLNAGACKLPPRYMTTDSATWRHLKPLARGLRREQTEAENILWQRLRNRQLGVKFRRQHAIGEFIVDFVCLERRLVVEVDGGIHKQQKEYDEERSRILAALGFRVIRFWNDEVINNLEYVLAAIEEAIREPLAGEEAIYGEGGNETPSPADLGRGATPPPTPPRRGGVVLAAVHFDPTTPPPTPPQKGGENETEAESALSNNLEARLRHLLAYHDEPHQFSPEEAETLIAAIDNLKALDPACGSGAFPMGLLHKLVHLLGKLDPRNEQWKERQIARVRDAMTAAEKIEDAAIRERSLKELESQIESIEDAFARGELDYGRKLYLIENCIYGVDIQPIAVQIAKMRFFISLTVEQKVDPTAPNLGIRPLPNLETKFVAANTLIGVERPAQGVLRNPEIDAKEAELRRIRERHFTARTPAAKARLREQDAKIRAEISELLRQDGFPRETTEKLAAWDPYDQNASADFFDPEWMFGVRDGFDIVIGNPPYLESRSHAFSNEMKTKLLDAIQRRWRGIEVLSYITRGADLLVFFLETSLSLIHPQGIVVLITQNAWLDTDYGKHFQEFLLRTTHVSLVVDSDFKHFKSAYGPNINTVITFFKGRKPEPQKAITFARFTGQFDAGLLPSSGDTINKALANVKFLQYRYDSPTLQKTKWGILLSLEDTALDLLSILEKCATPIEHISIASFSVGQGLNLTKEYFLNDIQIKKLSFIRKAMIPIFTSVDGAPFQIIKTCQYLADTRRLNKEELEELRKHGIASFDPSATKKTPPVLILPRGIGRHFCAINRAKAYSASAVDIYAKESSINEDMLLNLWIILNSSITWLMREVSGRKNLGGGMLKAEATDLASLPLYMDLGEKRSIKKIAEKLWAREALDPILELETEEHRAIDALVFDSLNLSEKNRKQILDSLKKKLIERTSKAKT
ncbi:MAG: DUF559 domain-containing protein [candidate division KSB1 bacterium]|nr:DUF559 domain-containing protein [candidate division KSB1 bacterium]